MLDTIRLERSGIPAVVVVHDRFEKAALATGKMLNMPSAKMIVIPEGMPGESTQALREKVDVVWDRLLAGIIDPR